MHHCCTPMCIFWFQCIWVCVQDCYLWIIWKFYFKVSGNLYDDLYSVTINSLSHQQSRSFFLFSSIVCFLLHQHLFNSLPFISPAFVVAHFIGSHSAINIDIDFLNFFVYLFSVAHTLCMYIDVCVPRFLCVSQSTTGRSCFSPFSMWILCFELGSLGHWQQVPESVVPSC